jgi:tetratricopeptide (TPR) repeat protein
MAIKKSFYGIILLFFFLTQLFAYKFADNIEEHFRYGYELFQANRLDEAEVEFRNLILINPHLGLGYLWLGRVLQKKGLLQEAIKVWRTGFSEEPANKEIKALLSKYYQNDFSKGEVKTEKSSSPKKVPPGYKEVVYKVKPNDTLKKIAQYYFGDESMASKIAQYNNIDYLGQLGDNAQLKILVPEERLAKLKSLSENLEKKYLQKEKEGESVGGVEIQIASKPKKKPPHKVIVIDTSSIEEETEQSPKLREKIKLPSDEEKSSTSEKDPKTPQQGETSTTDGNGQNNEMKVSETVDNLIEICNDNKKKIEDAILNYNLEHMEEMNKDNFSLETLKREGYLKKIPKCPEGGKYYMNDNGRIKCSFHD